MLLHPQPGRLFRQKRHPEVAPVHQKHIRIVKAQQFHQIGYDASLPALQAVQAPRFALVRP